MSKCFLWVPLMFNKLSHTHTHIRYVHGRAHVSLVCHSELCPYVTKHKHVLFILERKEANSHCQGMEGWRDGWRERKRKLEKLD